MSRNLSSDKNKKDSRIRTTRNIFQSSGSNSNTNSLRSEEADPNQSRRRTERVASQGVKVLVNREKGIGVDSDVSMSESIRDNSSLSNITAHNIPAHNVPHNNPHHSGRALPSPNMNMNPNIHPYPSNPLNNPPQPGTHPISLSRPQIFSRSFKDDKILNKQNFEKLLSEKLRKEGLEIKNANMNDITNFFNNGLESYLKNVLEKLISVSRIRNVNLNLYSKLSEKNPVFKIHTFNQIPTPNPSDVGYSPYKDFSILFTKNMKNTMGMLEQYEELNLKKLRQERVTLYKNKLEEISALKEKEKDEKTNPVKTIQTKPRMKKRDTMLKRVRSTLAKSQKRDEMARHKKETQNTLETFLDNKPRTKESFIGGGNLSQHRFDAEIGSNVAESHNFETYTKFSEISKSEVPGTINIAADGSSNDINLSLFKYYNPSQNVKIPNVGNVKRRITLKDLIHFLEGERKTPLQNLILHRAVVKLNQSSH